MISSLAKNASLRGALTLSLSDCRLMQAQTLLDSSQILRKHGALQHSLAAAQYLCDLDGSFNEAGLNVNSAAAREVAAVLWSHGEAATSITILEGLKANSNLEKESVVVRRSGLLATLVGFILFGIWIFS